MAGGIPSILQQRALQQGTSPQAVLRDLLEEGLTPYQVAKELGYSRPTALFNQTRKSIGPHAEGGAMSVYCYAYDMTPKAWVEKMRRDGYSDRFIVSELLGHKLPETGAENFARRILNRDLGFHKKEQWPMWVEENGGIEKVMQLVYNMADEGYSPLAVADELMLSEAQWKWFIKKAEIDMDRFCPIVSRRSRTLARVEEEHGKSIRALVFELGRKKINGKKLRIGTAAGILGYADAAGLRTMLDSAGITWADIISGRVTEQTWVEKQKAKKGKF